MNKIETSIDKIDLKQQNFVEINKNATNPDLLNRLYGTRLDPGKTIDEK